MDDKAATVTVGAAFWGGGFAAFIGFGLVMRAGLLSAGGAAFLDSVFGKLKTSSIAFAVFFFGPLPVGSSFANLFCWVSVSIILGGVLVIGTL